MEKYLRLDKLGEGTYATVRIRSQSFVSIRVGVQGQEQIQRRYRTP